LAQRLSLPRLLSQMSLPPSLETVRFTPQNDKKQHSRVGTNFGSDMRGAAPVPGLRASRVTREAHRVTRPSRAANALK